MAGKRTFDMTEAEERRLGFVIRGTAWGRALTKAML